LSVRDQTRLQRLLPCSQSCYEGGTCVRGESGGSRGGRLSTEMRFGPLAAPRFVRAQGTTTLPQPTRRVFGRIISTHPGSAGINMHPRDRKPRARRAQGRDDRENEQGRRPGSQGWQSTTMLRRSARAVNGGFARRRRSPGPPLVARSTETGVGQREGEARTKRAHRKRLKRD